MKIVVDAQLPPALARALCEAGEDARPVREVGLREVEDDAIWEYALKNGAAVVTKDEDFAERAGASRISPVVIWLRVGNTSNRSLLSWLMPLWPEIRDRIEAGDRLIEVRQNRSQHRP